MNIVYSEDLTGIPFKDKFYEYLQEMGIQGYPWYALYRQMKEHQTKAFFLYDNGYLAGFSLFTTVNMTSWIIRQRVCYIAEFYIDPNYRHKGYGHWLLMQTEQYAREHGLLEMVLTSQDAGEFYRRFGYWQDYSMKADNNDPVWVKRI